MNGELEHLLEIIAKDTNTTKENVKKDMESMIKFYYNDPKRKKKMIELFGERIPSLEEYLEKTSLKKYAKKNNC